MELESSSEVASASRRSRSVERSGKELTYDFKVRAGFITTLSLLIGVLFGPCGTESGVF